MQKTEILLAFFALTGFILSLMLIPGSAIMSILSLSLLSMLYFYFGFALFNGISLRDIFKKQSYNGISGIRIAGAIGTGFALSVIVIGLLFKTRYWPGASAMLITGLPCLLIIIILAGIRYMFGKDLYYSRILKRTLPFAGLGLLFMFITYADLAAIKYRNHPEYVNALRESEKYPDSLELWNRAEAERQKFEGSDDYDEPEQQ